MEHSNNYLHGKHNYLHTPRTLRKNEAIFGSQVERSRPQSNSKLFYRLEIVEGGVVPMKKLAKKLKNSGVDTSSYQILRRRREAGTEEAVYHTNELTDFLKRASFFIAIDSVGKNFAETK
jgi:hypothetical protein